MYLVFFFSSILREIPQPEAFKEVSNDLSNAVLKPGAVQECEQHTLDIMIANAPLLLEISGKHVLSELKEPALRYRLIQIV